MLDDRGRTPEPPYPAYQQVLKGLPAVDYRSDELFYLPRNLRSHRVYGYSPVEQVVMTVNIALRRQLHQLQYYTEGNVPEALIGVPETWTPDQIGQFQAYWDALLEGDTAQRRHARFVPATISKSFVQTKDAGLKDDYDEWLARIVCFAFSVSPQALVRAMNRATAETAHDQALQEGLLPLMRWVKELVDRTLSEGFGYHDLEFAWQESNDLDALTQAKIAQVYLAAGVLTPQEVRASLGLGNEQKGGTANAGRPFGKFDINQARDAFGRWVAEGEAAASSAATQVGHALKPLRSGAAVGGAVGAVVGGVAGVVGATALTTATGGLNAPFMGAEVVGSAITGGYIGHDIGQKIDEALHNDSAAAGLGITEPGMASKEHDPSNPPIPGAVPGDLTAGPTENWDKEGGFTEAEKDFDALQPKAVKAYPGGMKVGILPDGRTVKLRPKSGRKSEDGPPTIEIENEGYLRGARKIKVRYKDGEV